MSGWGCAQALCVARMTLWADLQNITVVGLKVWENAQCCKNKHYFGGDFQNLRFHWHFITFDIWHFPLDPNLPLSLFKTYPNKEIITLNDRNFSHKSKISNFHSPDHWAWLTLLNAGGGLEEPPLSYKCGSSKNAQRKSCWFFFTFPKYVNGVLETTFCSQITFGLTGRWQKWSKLAKLERQNDWHK